MKYHELYALAHYYQGIISLKENKLEEASTSLEEGLQHASKIYGKDTTNCAKYNTAIAEYYLLKNEPIKAKAYLDRSIKALES